MKQDLTTGKPLKVLIYFALPYLLSSFLQTFYGMADLFIVGQFYPAQSISAVSIGSQFMHMMTVMIIGLAVGTTVRIGNAVGGKRYKDISGIIKNSIYLFVFLAIIATPLLYLCTSNIVSIMQTPSKAVIQCIKYLKVCFLGMPFIIAYNVVCSVYRGMGDSKSPMVFVGIACVINIVLDYIFVGGMHLNASGAAYATVIAQCISFILALIYISKKDFGYRIILKGEKYVGKIIRELLESGLPICLQDGFIQISFLIITMIANSLGLIPSTSVGIVEKIISFLFLVPSAMLSSLSAIVAQNIGANKKDRADLMLKYALKIDSIYGAFVIIMCQIIPAVLVGLFTKDSAVVASGADYLRSYSVDTLFAGIHFAFSGYFTGSGHSSVSFIHNIISVIGFRIPICYFAAKTFGTYLLPMGFAAPIGSFVSAVICIGFFIYFNKKDKISA